MGRWGVATLAWLAGLGAATAAAREARAAAPDVTIAGADGLVWNTEAVHGTLDDVIPLVAGNGDGDATVAVSVSRASQGGAMEPDLELHLSSGAAAGTSARDAFGQGAGATTVRLGSGQRSGVRVVGFGFDQQGTYRAAVTVGDRAYGVRIKVTTPLPPLGLELTEWSQAFPAFPWTNEITASACIPVDARVPLSEPLHVVASPPDPATADTQRVPPGSVKAGASDMCPSARSFLLTVGPMRPGRYSETLEVQGEKLKVDLAFRAPAYVVLVTVLLGALGSMAVRAFARGRKAAAQREYETREIERSQRKFALVCDVRRVANELQLARGSNRAFLRDDVAMYLEEARKIGDSFTSLGTLVSQLESSVLPARIRQQLQRDIGHVRRLSSTQDVPVVVATLEKLLAESKTAFRERVAAWLMKEREILAARALEADELSAMVHEPRRSLLKTRAGDAFASLGRLIDDVQTAWASAQRGGPPVDARHLALVERVQAATSDIWTADTERAFRRATAAAMILDLPRDRSPFPEATWVPRLAIVVEPDPPAQARTVTALEETTFAVSGVPPESIPHLRMEWSVRDGEWFEGGPRLSHVFESAVWLATVRVRVRPMTPGQKLARSADGREVWDGGVLEAEWSQQVAEPDGRLRRLRLASSVADMAVLAVGIVVVGMLATVLAGEKQLGTTSDFVGLLLAGVGVDTTTSSTLLRGAFQFVTQGRKAQTQ
jgi:hypothetical protein